MSKEKFVVWSNLDLDLDDWRADLEDEYPGLNDDELIEKMNEINDSYGLVKNKTFTIGGVTKSGWSSDYLLPSGTTNRIPWVIVYEPIVKMHLKDRVNTVAFTATEYVISAEYGWYDWYKSVGKGQNVGIVPYRHLPSSVQRG